MTHSEDLAAGKRFTFGKNWENFLSTLNEERVLVAKESLRELLDVVSLDGKTFLDAGSGSGLFSLAAKRLGARVHSFDYDPQSVACTAKLRKRYFPDDPGWIVEEGSVLDTVYLSKLGQFDIVYSWGVLHHTGNMWKAIDSAASFVKPGGKLVIGIYNYRDGRRGTVTWQGLKRWYCKAPRWQAATWEKIYIIWKLAYMVCVGRNPVRHVLEYRVNRGMSWFRDVTDWLGGYPYEAATPGQILDYVRSRFGGALEKQNINPGLGVSEFVFKLHVESLNGGGVLETDG